MSKASPMKIVVSDCDHDTMRIEEDILADAGLGFIHLACRTEDDMIAACAGARGHSQPIRGRSPNGCLRRCRPISD